jgi:DNA end-binding protein Ku
MWKGVISFGMVAIPVRLNSATRSKDISFNLLHAACKSRLQQKRWCPTCDREVPWEDIVKGYQYSKDRYVLLEDEDFDKLPVASKHSISLSAFVDQSEIDPIFYEKTYFLEPDSAGGKPFALLWQALTRENKVGIAKIALREKERLCAIRPHEGTIALETLFYPDEVLQPNVNVGDAEVPEKELDLAVQIIQHLSEPFDPSQYTDEYRDTLNQLIEAKVQGEEPVFAPEAEPGNIIDLMAALRRTLETAKGDPDADPKPKRKGRAA